MNRPHALALRLALLAGAFAAVPAPAGAWSRGVDMRPPAALRTERVLDRAALERVGVERPTRLAFDAEGALYVLDSSRRRIVKIARDGELAHEVIVSGGDPGALAEPVDLLVDARGSVLVLDGAGGVVLAYDKTGALLAERPLGEDLLEEARAPGASLLLDALGRLWLLAPRERDLVRLDASLRRERTSRFLLPEEALEAPRAAVVAPPRETWVADASGRVLHFRSSGALASTHSIADTTGTPPDGRAEGDAVALAADAAGFVYVADREGQRVVVLDPNGRRRLERVLGGPVRRFAPAALALSADGRLAVADPDRGEIQILAVERAAP